ncbi:alpha/beta hydrolase [Pleomorphomonas sp. PLEO]|uniref:alpha/beta hydrolase n=1 Tax=Pleomorphomonas sp. PLEO TaxID=3239306 RepID=UPI00351DF521
MNFSSFPYPVMRAPEITFLSEGSANRFSGEWPDRLLGTVTRAELHSFTIAAPRARAIVYAGGGYTQIFYDKEGTEVALWLNGLGIDAHVLVHRLPGAPDGNSDVFPKNIALRDGLAALDHLAGDGSALPLFHVGLSSGGHLAAVMACQRHALSPRGALIAYAPINANHRLHKIPLGKPDYPPIEKQDFYDDWPIGLANHPHGLPKAPLFLAYALHDQSVPVQHALRLVETAAAAGLDVDAHIFGTAPHGFALRDRAGSHALWPELAADWIDRHL